MLRSCTPAPSTYGPNILLHLRWLELGQLYFVVVAPHPHATKRFA